MSDDNLTAARGPAQPGRWWQWILVYPTLALSLVAGLPTMIDKGGAAAVNLFKASDKPAIASLDEANFQKTMWQRNLTCDTELHSWQDTSIGIKVDATICPQTGDVLVQALDNNRQPHAKWLSAREQVVGADENSFHTAGLSLTIGAKAAAEIVPPDPRNPLGGSTSRSPSVIFVQSTVLCQKQVDNRTLLRRIRTPQGCFDILIDMFTGQQTQKPAPCLPQC